MIRSLVEMLEPRLSAMRSTSGLNATELFTVSRGLLAIEKSYYIRKQKPSVSYLFLIYCIFTGVSAGPQPQSAHRPWQG